MSLFTPDTDSRISLLLADDDPVLRRLYGAVLERHVGFNQDIVDGVGPALSSMATKQYAVVISDGLYGGWTEVLGAAMEQEAHPVLYSADLDIVQYATNIGIEAFDKGRAPFRQVLDLTLERLAS